MELLFLVLVQFYTLTDRDFWCYGAAAVVQLLPPDEGGLPGDDPPTPLQRHTPGSRRACHAFLVQAATATLMWPQ